MRRGSNRHAQSTSSSAIGVKLEKRAAGQFRYGRARQGQARRLACRVVAGKGQYRPVRPSAGQGRADAGLGVRVVRVPGSLLSSSVCQGCRGRHCLSSGPLDGVLGPCLDCLRLGRRSARAIVRGSVHGVEGGGTRNEGLGRVVFPRATWPHSKQWHGREMPPSGERGAFVLGYRSGCEHAVRYQPLARPRNWRSRRKAVWGARVE